jgi:gamma-glutamylaminecyclotransferase
LSRQSTDSRDFLFVYGTLKRGYCRAFALQQQEFLGPARTTAQFQLRDCGEYPALIRQQPGQSITGELYRIERQIYPLLDDLEGVEFGLYRREEISLLTPHTGLVVFTYQYAQPWQHLPLLGSSWPAATDNHI